MEQKQWDALIAEIKRRTAQKAYMVRVSDEKPSFTGSRFGGYPYWEKEREYISHPSGCRMMLLAQINFEEVAPLHEALPEKGLLQFFIADDDLNGLDFDNPAGQEGFRVIYHENIDSSVTEDDVRNMGIPSSTEEYDESYFPFSGQMKIFFEEKEDHIGTDDERFDSVLKEAMNELGYDDSESDDQVPDDFYDAFNTFGHKMLGYPGFTQSDPRHFEGAMERYETLLLQIDSEDGILWGDMGICNFFISREKLKKLDFTDVLYNWDCC